MDYGAFIGVYLNEPEVEPGLYFALTRIVSLPEHKSAEGPGLVVEQCSPRPYRPLCEQRAELVYAPPVVVHTPGGRRPGAERASGDARMLGVEMCTIGVRFERNIFAQYDRI